MANIMDVVLHLIYFVIGGTFTLPSDNLTSVTYGGVLPDITSAILDNPIMVISVAAFVVAIVFGLIYKAKRVATN